MKAAGVVIDDGAVTPRYVVGFAAKRDLRIVATDDRFRMPVDALADEAGRITGQVLEVDGGWGVTEV